MLFLSPKVPFLSSANPRLPFYPFFAAEEQLYRDTGYGIGRCKQPEKEDGFIKTMKLYERKLIYASSFVNISVMILRKINEFGFKHNDSKRRSKSYIFFWIGTKVRFSKVQNLRSLKLFSGLAGTILTKFSMRIPNSPS